MPSAENTVDHVMCLKTRLMSRRMQLGHRRGKARESTQPMSRSVIRIEPVQSAGKNNQSQEWANVTSANIKTGKRNVYKF